MPPRQLPKRRRLLVESSEDEETQFSNPNPFGTPPLRSRPSTLASGINAHSSVVSTPNIQAYLHTPTVCSASTRSYPVAKSPAPPDAVVNHQPIHPLFASQRLSSQPRQLTASQNEDLGDLIEDAVSDNSQDEIRIGNPVCIAPGSNLKRQSVGGAVTTGFSSFSKPSHKVNDNQRSQTRPKKRNASSCDQNYRECTIPINSNDAQSGTVVIDPRPWPERFAPRSSVDLAVHPRKVSEVRSWLQHSMEGFSKQRLLILKGSAGTGKTATIKVLSKELGFDVLEWKNPSGTHWNSPTDEGAFSTGLIGVFEEFVGRAGRFASLEMVSTTNSITTKTSPTISPSYSEEEKRKLILIEDFPNALFTTSQAPLAAFRQTVKSYLAMSQSPSPCPPLPPLVLIISESSCVTGPGAFTAHRLLSPDILHHPMTGCVTFNKIAPTFMLKALSAIITQECRESGRTFVPSKPLMAALTSSGDVRSAIMGLEFLSVNGDLGTFSQKTTSLTKIKKKEKSDIGLSELERKTLVSVTQRESRFGIFHAIGKVVHNKRYGDDIDDPYTPSPPIPLLPCHPRRCRASRVDINTLIDESGVDAQTLIAGLHENYLGSCNFLGGFSPDTHSTEDLLDCINDCLESLSDSDLLGSPRPYHNTLGRGAGNGNYECFEGTTGTVGIRQDESSFQVAVRGIILALPSPVKRDVRDNKMYYPTSLRLWRDKEEMEGLVDLFIRRFRGPDDDYAGPSGDFGVGRSEMALERLPYFKIILNGHQRESARNCSSGLRPFEMTGGASGSTMMELEKITQFRGIIGQSEEVPDEDSLEGFGIRDELQVAEEKMDIPVIDEQMHGKLQKNNARAGKQPELKAECIDRLVLFDDDIEDDW